MNRNKEVNIWVDRLSIWSLPGVLKYAFRRKSAHVYFIECSVIFTVLIRVIFRKISFNRIDYSLGDMSIGDLTLGVRFCFEMTELSKKVISNLRGKRSYKEAAGLLPKDKVDTYFEKRVSEEISGFVRFLLVVSWNASKYNCENRFFFSYSPLYEEVISVDDHYHIKVEFYRDHRHSRVWLAKVLKHEMRRLCFFRNIIGSAEGFPNEEETLLAIHYAEGMDLDSRSDIFWLKNSGIDAKKIIFYLDTNKRLKDPLQGFVCATIGRMRSRWICLDKKALSLDARRMGKKLRFSLSEKCENLPSLFSLNYSPLDRWISATFRELMIQIWIWKNIYRAYKIKLVFDIGAQTTEAIAQNIALDSVGGLRVSAQRSIAALTKGVPLLSYNANHIFFVWGRAAIVHEGTSPIIRRTVVTGYTFDHAFRDAAARGGIDKLLKDRNGKFVIALFDNGCSKDIVYSRKMLELFYRAFLKWLREDDDIVVVIKEKKPIFLNNIYSVLSSIERFVHEGRLIRLKDALGRFPIDAAYDADMCVGLGISSAIIETVIAGRRSLHCDLAKHYCHSFYDSGKGKIIFDDIEVLVSALKRYKQDVTLEPELGYWADWVEGLDPFRDGKAAERVGSYMGWIFDFLEADKQQDEAMSQADELYGQRWGVDKIIASKVKA